MSYSVPTLGYGYGALEPVIDSETMRLHHDFHHQVYVDALNETIVGYPELAAKTIEDLLRSLEEVPQDIRAAVREYGGGHANHQLFWKVMAPPAANGPGPTGALAEQIIRDFGSFEAMKEEFEAAGNALIGPGWVYLSMDPQRNSLEIVTLRNNESVLFIGKPALFAIDLWEHAYYIKYHNRKADYLRAWWKVVAWPYIGERWTGIAQGKKHL